MLVHTFCRILFGDTGLIISIFWRVVEQVPHTLLEYHGDVWEPGAGLEPANLPITNRLLYQLSYPGILLSLAYYTSILYDSISEISGCVAFRLSLKSESVLTNSLAVSRGASSTTGWVRRRRTRFVRRRSIARTTISEKCTISCPMRPM